MPFSYPLTMPLSPAPRESRIRLVRAQSSSQSPFTFDKSIYSYSGQRWEVELDFPPMTLTTAQEWISFFLELQGQEGTFYFSDPDGGYRGSPVGTPTIKSVNANKRQLVSQGWTPSSNNVLKAGDWFQVGSELKRCIADVDSDGAGEATIYFQSRVRDTALTNGSPITVNGAKGIFRLAAPDFEYNSDSLKLHGFSLIAVEAI